MVYKFLFPKAAAVTPPQDPSRQTTTVRLREHTQDTLDSGYKEEAVIRAWYGNPQREWVSAPGVGIDVTAKVKTLLMLGNDISAANRSTGNPFDNAVVTVDEVRSPPVAPAPPHQRRVKRAMRRQARWLAEGIDGQPQEPHQDADSATVRDEVDLRLPRSSPRGGRGDACDSLAMH